MPFANRAAGDRQGSETSRLRNSGRDGGKAAASDLHEGLSLAAVFVWMAVCFLALAVPLLAPDRSELAAVYLDPRRVNEALWSALACAALLIIPPLVHGSDPLRSGWRAAAARTGAHAAALSGLAMPFGLIATRYFPLQQYAYLACLLFLAALLFAALSAYALAPQAYHAASCAVAGGMPLTAYLLCEFRALGRGDDSASSLDRTISLLLGYSPVSGAIRPLVAAWSCGLWDVIGPPAIYLLAGFVFILALWLTDMHGRRPNAKRRFGSI